MNYKKSTPSNQTSSLYEALQSFKRGGRYADGGVNNGDPTKEEIAEAAAKRAAAKAKEIEILKMIKDRQQVHDPTQRMGMGGGKSTDVTMPGIVGEAPERPQEPQPTERRGDRMDPITPRGVRPIKTSRPNPALEGGTQTPTEMPESDYELSAISRGGADEIYTEARNKGIMGVKGRKKGGKEKYYYLPEMNQNPGFSKGSHQKQTQAALKDIRKELGEDAYTEALGILMESGVDISKYEGGEEEDAHPLIAGAF